MTKMVRWGTLFLSVGAPIPLSYIYNDFLISKNINISAVLGAFLTLEVSNPILLGMENWLRQLPDKLEQSIMVKIALEMKKLDHFFLEKIIK